MQLDITNVNPASNITTMVGGAFSSPRTNQTMMARSGAFNNGSLTVRSPDKTDNLAKEFAILRGEAPENPMDALDNTVDVVDFHYQTAQPIPSKTLRSYENQPQPMGKISLKADSARQSGQQGIIMAQSTTNSNYKLDYVDNNAATKQSLDGLGEEHQALLVEIDEQKSVINQLIDQLTEKTLEIAEMKGQVDQAFKQAAQAKTDLLTAKLENEQLAELVEILRNKITNEKKKEVKKGSSTLKSQQD